MVTWINVMLRKVKRNGDIQEVFEVRIKRQDLPMVEKYRTLKE